MRVLIDVRPAATCLTGIGRYARMLEHVARVGVPGHSCALGGSDRLQFSSAREEELALPALLAREGVELFHSPLFHLPVLLEGCCGAITIHDAVPVAHPELSTPGFARLFERAAEAARRAAVVICPSQTARDEVASALSLPPEKVHVVPETPAPVFLRPPPAGRPRAGERFMLVVGSVEARKNPRLVLEALALAPDLPPVIFVGPPGGFDLVAEAERLGVRDRVRQEGWLPDQQVARLYRQAALLLFTSRHEGFGLPIVEAFASGLPVVASTAGSLPEVAGDAALLVDPDDAQGLADAARRLLAEAELRTLLVERGRSRLADHYSAEAVRRGLATAWDRVAAERGAAA